MKGKKIKAKKIADDVQNTEKSEVSSKAKKEEVKEVCFIDGKEEILNKIRQDAQKKVNSTLEEGNKRGQEEICIAHNDAQIYGEQNMEASIIERDEIIERRKTVANLEVKKLMLQAKKEIIDKSFNEAIKLIKADKEAYLALIGRMLTFADDGDIIEIAESDKKEVSKKFILDKTKEMGKTVTISSEYGKFLGGIMILGKNADKNLTLESELNIVKDEYEPKISEILFGE